MMQEKGIELLISHDTSNMNYLTGYDAWSFYYAQCVIVHINSEEPICFVRDQDAGGAYLKTYIKKENIIVYDEQCGSFAEDAIQVNLFTQSEAFTADDIITCDDSSDDGIENFDLSLQNSAILGSQDPTQFTISYHESESDAQQGVNSLDTNYTNSNNVPTFGREYTL